MNIVNKQIKHILYGEGQIINQEANVLSIQFSEQYGTKKFIYPDAFEKYLKLSDSDIESTVLEELHDKQAQTVAEELQKQQEYEEFVKSRELERSNLAAHKKKPSSKSKVPKQKFKSDLSVSEESEENEE